MVKFRAKNVWWNHRIRCAALVGLTSVSLLGSESREAFAEWFPKAKAPKQSETQEPPANSSFDDAIRKLLKEAKSAEKKGEIDRAIILAERAAKISEASSEIVKAASDVSPAATARYAHDLRLRKVELAAKPPAGTASHGPPLVASRSSKKSAVTKEGLAPARRTNPVVAGPKATNTADERVAAAVTDPRSQIKAQTSKQSSPKQESNLPDFDLFAETRATKPIEPRVENQTADLTKESTGTQDRLDQITELASTSADDKPSSAISDKPSTEIITLGTGKNWEAVTSSTVTPISSSALSNDDVSESVDTDILAKRTESVQKMDIREFKDIRRLNDLGDNFQSHLATTRMPAAPVNPIETASVTPLAESNESTTPVENQESAVVSHEVDSQPGDDIREVVASTDSIEQKTTAPELDIPQVAVIARPEPAKTETPYPKFKLRRQFRETDLSKDSPLIPESNSSDVMAPSIEDSLSNPELATIAEEHSEALVPQTEIASKPQYDLSPSVDLRSSNDWDKADSIESPNSSDSAKSVASAEIVATSQPKGPASFKLRPAFRDHRVTAVVPGISQEVPVPGDEASGTSETPNASTGESPDPRPSFRLRPSFGNAKKTASADFVASARTSGVTDGKASTESFKVATAATVAQRDTPQSDLHVEPSFQAPLPPGMESAKSDPMSASDRKKADNVAKSVAERTQAGTSSQRSSASPTDLVGSIQRSRKARPIVSEDDHAASTRAILSSGPIQRLAKVAGIPNSTASAMFVVFGITLLMAGLWMIRTTVGIKHT